MGTRERFARKRSGGNVQNSRVETFTRHNGKQNSHEGTFARRDRE